MESERERKILKHCGNLATHYINSILELKCPDIGKNFPDFPNDVPEELLFTPPNTLTEKSSTKPKKPRVKKEKVPKDSKLDVDEQKSSNKSKRKNRYSGSYDVEKKLSKLLDEQSSETDEDSTEQNTKDPVNSCQDLRNGRNDENNELLDMSGIQKLSPKSNAFDINNNNDRYNQKEQQFNTFIIKKGMKENVPKISRLSDTSSDEDEEIEKKLDLVIKFPVCLLERCDAMVNLANKTVNSPGKSLTLPQTSKETIKSTEISKPFINPQTSKETIKSTEISKPVIKKPQKGQNCKALKSIFQESTGFDDAMQKYAEKKRELLKFVPPKVIPAPEQDPSIKKSIKKKLIKANGNKTDEDNPNKHLGGIFTINNGWDKQEIKKFENEAGNKRIEEKTENKKVENVSKLERHITPPNIVVNADIDDEFNEYVYDENFVDNFLRAQDSKTSFSSDSSHNLQIALSNDKLLKNNGSFKERKINSSLNSSEEDSENDEIIKPPKKTQRISYSDDEEEEKMETEVTENENKNQDNDVVSLFAEAGEFDDLEEEKEQFYAEVDPDDLKIKVQCVKRIIEPLNHQTEFDMNTLEITQHIVDPETDKILKNFFGSVCPAFLESRCSMPKCERNHFLPEELKVHPLLINANFDVLHKVFQVVLRFHRLFQAYISVLVDVCVKNKDDVGLAELVKACDRLPRTIPCYKDIVRKLIELDYMKEHRAISFIIAHHTDSEIARDTILSLILDSGPCISFFMDYVEKAHIKQPIRHDMFSKILHTCVAYQNPKLPNFCLNYLHGCNSNQMKSLNSEHLKAFLQMNKCISELNDNREAKAFIVASKMLNGMNWQ